jgi:rhodanese-related sulfurtransferase
MKVKGFGLSALTIVAVLAALSSTPWALDVPRLTKEEVRPLIGNPEVVIVDVRTGRDWDESAAKIQGAVREDPGSVDKWMGKYPKEKTLIFYCA